MFKYLNILLRPYNDNMSYVILKCFLFYKSIYYGVVEVEFYCVVNIKWQWQGSDVK